jgi:hypothetical protein
VGACAEVTVNGDGLAADPDGVVTVNVPLLAPAGTVTTRPNVDAELIAADAPPKLTLSALAVVLNPVP